MRNLVRKIGFGLGIGLSVIVIGFLAQFVSPPSVFASGIDSNAILITHMDGTASSTTFTDSSFTSSSLTAVGNAKISTDLPKFGTGSGWFDGTNSLVDASSSSAFNLGASDFTLDFWLKYNSVANSLLISKRYNPSVSYSWQFYYQTGNLIFQYTTDGITQSTAFTNAWSPTANTWYHIAAVRNGVNLMVFVNGTQLGSTGSIASTIYSGTANLDIGGGTGGYYLSGYLDEVRISNIARWTANFTPPTQPYDTSGSITSDCTGGTVTHSGGNTINTFTASGTLTCSMAGASNISVLVIGGGGGGGTSAGGGGGGGGATSTSNFTLVTSTTTVVIGNGGIGGTSGNAGQPGATSSILSSPNTLVMTGGGGGAGDIGTWINSGKGASGGGSSYHVSYQPPGTGIAGQGYGGGSGGDTYLGGGGGGAGSVGSNYSGTTAGNGGSGLTSSISGFSKTYSCGGNGSAVGSGNSASSTVNACGAGRAGVGSGATGGTGSDTGENGIANTGQGGGAGGSNTSTGGNGASGIVIFSYPTPNASTTVITRCLRGIGETRGCAK